MDDECKSLSHIFTSSFDVDQKDDYGNTALHLALKYGRWHCARILIANNADVNKEADYTDYLVSIPAESKVHRDLLRNFSGVNKFVDGKLPLHEQLRKGNVNTAVAFVAYAGADVNLLDQTGQTAIHIAAEDNYPEFLRQILPIQLPLETTGTRIARTTFVDVDRLNREQETALQLAMKQYCWDCARLLIANRADVNRGEADESIIFKALNNEGTPKSLAVDIARNFTGDVNEILYGYTLMVYALKNDFEDAAILLFNKGGDINKVDNSGRTPVQWAASLNRKKFLQEVFSVTINKNV